MRTVKTASGARAVDACTPRPVAPTPAGAGRAVHDPLIAVLVLAWILVPDGQAPGLPAFVTDDFREALSAVRADDAGLGPGVLVLYGVGALYFETDTADEFGAPGSPRSGDLSHR